MEIIIVTRGYFQDEMIQCALALGPFLHFLCSALMGGNQTLTEFSQWEWGRKVSSPPLTPAPLLQAAFPVATSSLPSLLSPLESPEYGRSLSGLLPLFLCLGVVSPPPA